MKHHGREKNNSPKNMLTRMNALLMVIALFLAGSVFRVFYLQVFRAEELSQKATSQQTVDSEIKAMRGTIYDCDGNVLAQSATVWNVFIDPYALKLRAKEGTTPTAEDLAELEVKTEKRRQTVIDGLTKLLELDEEDTQKLTEMTYKEESRYELVKKQVENDLKMKISEFASKNDLNCIGYEQSAKRYYPYDSLASTVLGFVGDDGGLYGLERQYDDVLTGTNGRVITVKDAWLNDISDEYETSVEASDGNSLVLTINQSIQYQLEKGLRETMEEYQSKGAYGIVMNCNTGAVLAMASLPDYNCNNPTKITYSRYKKALKQIKDKEEREKEQKNYRDLQFKNYTIEDIYEPGSVFKTFTASAALEENVVSLNTTYNCTGAIKVNEYTMKCHYHPGHGLQTFTQGLENSCNPFFITVGQRLGVHNYFKYFDGFGFTEKTGIDLPQEAMSSYYTENQYSIVELSSAAFGQTNSLTPIQVCTAMCAIANGGTLMKPYIVGSIVDSQGKTISKTNPTEIRQVISSETAATVRQMMKSVVDNGTGKNGYVAGYSVAGKTGTSTKLSESAIAGRDKYIVSFAALAPSEKPEITMIIIVDEPNQDLGGGALCAPIAAQVVEETMSILGIEPTYNEKELSSLSSNTPNVTGMTLNKAKEELGYASLKYVVIGNGGKVTRQCPTSAGTISSNGTVYLYTDNAKKQTVKVPDFTGLTVTEAKTVAGTNNLNIEINGNNMNSGTVVAFRQSVEKGSKVEKGTVITVSFKNTESVLD